MRRLVTAASGVPEANRRVDGDVEQTRDASAAQVIPDEPPQARLATLTPSAAPRKQLGAYYTDAAVAEFLVRWAVGSGRETVLDPSFGGGVFF